MNCGMERESEEALPWENTTERMTDRPHTEDTDLNTASGALDDTDAPLGSGAEIDDV